MARDDLDLEGLDAPEWLLRHVARLERRAWVAEKVALVAAVASIITILLVGPLTFVTWKTAVDGDELKRATDAVATDSCEAQNEFRGTLRDNLTFQVRQTDLVPDDAFSPFGLSKQDALDGLRGQRMKLHGVDCERRTQPLQAVG